VATIGGRGESDEALKAGETAPGSAVTPARRHVVGLLVDTIAAHGRGILLGISAYGLHANWAYRKHGMWLFDTAPDVRGWRVDGVIASVHSPAMLELVAELGVPVVNISGAGAGTGLPSVVTDSAAIGRLAAEHLLDRGLTHLAYVGMPRHAWSEVRWQSFAAVAAERGVDCRTYPGQPLGRAADDHEAQRALAAWLAALPTPAGVFAGNDTVADAVLVAARDAGRHVPEDLAVLGVDNDEMTNRMAAMTLSSIDPNSERIGYEAARVLDELMAGKPPPDAPVRVPPVGVVARASSDVLAIPDPDVATAVRFIRDHAREPITVDDVLAGVPLSRRPLEKRFRRVLGRSILDEIHRVHVEQAKQLLVKTDLPMPQVARASGFSTATRLGIVFRQATGQRPTDYRLQFRLRR
jgi:LacI family transcriptional regulator